jgi:hypothetical protein
MLPVSTGRQSSPLFLDCLPLKMKAPRTFELSVTVYQLQRHNFERTGIVSNGAVRPNVASILACNQYLSNVHFIKYSCIFVVNDKSYVYKV